ncbi:hypothetical protein CN318_12345 [Bacillus cereus]|nr:hypothetical protein CN318_12345 [Bacillus cereus]
MKCNGKLLTEEQIDRLQFMLNNYYKKSMDICSCDVERVLGNKELELTKIEKAIVFGIIVRSIGEQEIVKHIAQDTLEQEAMDQLTIVFKDILYNTSLKTINESTVGAINKIFQDLLEDN